MAKKKKSIVLVLVAVLVGIFSFYGYTFYINPVERSAYVCRAGDGTAHPEESLLGCSSIIDWKHCTNGFYEKNPVQSFRIDGADTKSRTWDYLIINQL